MQKAHLLLPSMIPGSKGQSRFHYHVTVSSNLRSRHQNSSSRFITENSWTSSKLHSQSLLQRNSILSRLKNSGNQIRANLKNGYIRKAILATAGMKSMQRYMPQTRKDHTVTLRQFLLPS